MKISVREHDVEQGVFETIRTYRGKLFAVPAHVQRLRQGARALGLTVPLSNSQLTKALAAQCRTSGETRLKISLTQASVAIESKPWRLPRRISTQGVAVATRPGKRARPSLKRIDRPTEDVAIAWAEQHGYFDAILVDQQAAPECACSNLFFIHDRVLYTPDTDILFGITRSVVLQLAKAVLPIRFVTPTITQLYQADECFLTRTGVGIAPIVKINRTVVGNGKPGPVTKQLVKLFDAYATR